MFADEQPLRGELFSVDQLERHAKTLAGTHEVDARGGPDKLLDRLQENEDVLVRAYELVIRAVENNRRISPAAEWMLDNFYLIEEQIRTARRHLPKDYSVELPRLASGPSAGRPRVYDTALELISHVDGRVDLESLTSFVASYQTVSTLKLGELWAVPIMLRLALIENLRRVAARIAAGRLDRDRANDWAERIIATAEKDPKDVVVVLADLVKSRQPMTGPFVAELSRRLQGHGPGVSFAMTWVEQRLGEQGLNAQSLVQHESATQAADQVSIGNSIGSLRFIGGCDWRDFVESLSIVEGVLRQDPADVYVRMDFASRDRYRHSVETIARRTTRTETEVAEAAVALSRHPDGTFPSVQRSQTLSPAVHTLTGVGAESASRETASADSTSPDPRAGHVGYWLIDEGRPRLERAVGSRTPMTVRLGRAVRRLPLLAYLGAVLTVALLVGIAAGWTTWASMRYVGPGAATWAASAAWGVGVVAFLAGTQLGVSLTNWMATLLLIPRVLPRLDFSGGIPEACRTVVAVPTLLGSAAGVRDLLEGLEVRYLANRDPHLHLVLLTDLRDAASETLAADADLIALAKAGVEDLNEKYRHDLGRATDVFFLCHRPRRFNPREGVWMGHERKRGKLDDFNRLLREGRREAFSAIVGDVSTLPSAKYVITLDTDTQLPRDAARELAGAMAHPLNRATVDPRTNTVTRGYGLLQPRVAVNLPSARKSWYVRLFAGDPGIDPYTQAVSDVYQDLFGEGSFIGKGIYDIEAFHAATAGRFPADRILSHDLLEGSYVRGGLVTDVLLYEDHPSSYAADASRRHRWVRGDWQIASWTLPRVPGADGRPTRNPISALSRWKILDNLRRSVVPAALLATLVLGWALPLPLWASTLVTGVAVAVLLLPSLLSAALDLVRVPRDVPVGLHLRLSGQTAGRGIVGALLGLVFLPFDAFSNLDAIFRTLWRVNVSRRHLLEWQTSSDAERRAHTDLASFHRLIWAAPVTGLVVLAGLAWWQPDSLACAAPLAVAWMLAPTVAWSLSRPIARRAAAVSSDDVRFLRSLARRSWRFFDVFVSPGDNYLPPDNFQEHPAPVIAHRTSPTNIGLSLLSHLAAWDFGYVSTGYLLHRTDKTLETLGRMERYKGHFYNWYDTRSLEPLPPLYVSSVDSGNFTGSLLVHRLGLKEVADAPILPPRAFEGLADTVRVLLETAKGRDGVSNRRRAPGLPPDAIGRLDRLAGELDHPPRSLSGSRTLLQRSAVAAGDAAAACAADADETQYWSRALERQARELLEDLNHFALWADSPPPSERTWRRGGGMQIHRLGRLRDALRRLDEVPTLHEVARLCESLAPTLGEIETDLAADDGGAAADDGGGDDLRWVRHLRDLVDQASNRATARLAEIDRLASQCAGFADADYTFLYDTSRDLLTIGYNVSDRRRDAGHYDLLASEARLTSYTAIATGQLPQDHWFTLGRMVTTTGGDPALLSWSGSMFEYLMPLLVMPSYEGTLLDQTYHAVIARQVEYGRQRNVPWGISESGYNATDAALNYQYRAFGVPGLGLKRGLAEDLVIAPYASEMALMVDPAAAVANLRRMTDDGFMGAYGLYEAIDYSPSRVPRGQDHAVVRSFMSHHKGMGFLAMAYLLLDRPMQKRFVSDPVFRSADLLLQERVPKVAPVYPHASETDNPSRRSAGEAEGILRVFRTPDTPRPSVHLLSNGGYNVMVSAAGGGYSRWRDLAVTRWQEDPTRDCWGTFVYLRDLESGEFWSVAHQPTLKRAKHYEAVFSQARAEYRRRDLLPAANGRGTTRVLTAPGEPESGTTYTTGYSGAYRGAASAADPDAANASTTDEFDTHTEVSVSPEDDVELRRITLTNRGRSRRVIELTSYAEVVLAKAEADAAHQAFSNLFVQTQIVRPRQAILATRRARSQSERPPFLLHLMAVHGTSVGEATYETDKSKFVGRGRTLADPAAMSRRHLDDSEGSVLDPVVAVRRSVAIEPGQSVSIDVVTGVADNREQALALVEKYHDRRLADRVFEMAWTHSQVVLRQLNATETDAQLYGRLAGSVIYANDRRRAAPSLIARNRKGQSGLWGYGIGGDLPMVLLRVSDRTKIELVRQVIAAHGYWRMKGLTSDLVIWNEDFSGYRQELHDEIMGMVTAGPEASELDRPGGIFVRRAEHISEEDKVLMQTVARVILSDTGGTLGEQLDKSARSADTYSVPRFVPTRPRRGEVATAAELAIPELVFHNGIGGFTPDGREYIITTTPDTPTPAPWCNVLANPHFGTVVSESGGAYTWCENAHEFRLTPWYNDPVLDSSGEAFYVRDEETGRFFSPSPLPARGPMPYVTRHGFGYTVFEYDENAISTRMWTYVATDAPVKFVTIRLHNRSGRTRRFAVTGFVEWVLGELRPRTATHVVTELEPKGGAILARNRYNGDFGELVAFFDCSEAARSVTGDRTEFLGRNGTRDNPAAMGRLKLSGRIGAAYDPCAAIQTVIEVPDGQEKEVTFVLGCGRNRDEAVSLLGRFRGTAAARRALEDVWTYWNSTLGTLYVQTPDAALNVLANGWLPYQVLACRYWARSGYYQSGGAYGFRDQLQDVAAMLWAEPKVIREHILRACAHQFKEGDVQHWWHPPTGRGVRTHFSDDFLWLPLVVARYVTSTGDVGLLDERVPFLEGRPVKPDEEGYYDLPARSEESGTVYEHCRRAVQNGMKFGERGLPLIGCGDWNDGMNLVGEHGRGESVWLAFFFSQILQQFSGIARERNDGAFADQCLETAGTLRDNLERNAWDGEWYRRAYFDNGEPLGSASNPECQIDSLPQSWSVLTGATDPQRARQAMDAVEKRLVRRDARLIQLFDPPFDTSHLNPGYIKGYVPGVRENGGQYTHAAVWTVMAFAEMGDAERAWELFGLINPVNHGNTRSKIDVYKVEPYVVAADVYAVPPHVGRGGWTWYTGSAGWMYRLIVESLLGLRLEVNTLRVEPVLPAHWPGFDVNYRYRRTHHRIRVENAVVSQNPAASAAAPGTREVTRVKVDGVLRPDKTIPLVDDGRDHHIVVTIGGPPEGTPGGSPRDDTQPAPENLSPTHDGVVAPTARQGRNGEAENPQEVTEKRPEPPADRPPETDRPGFVDAGSSDA